MLGLIAKKKINMINMDTGFTDAKVALSSDKFLDVHMAVLARFEYFKMLYERNNFQNLPIEKRIFTFPEYSEIIIKKVIELIYYENPIIEDIETYRELRKLADFLNLLNDNFIEYYIIKQTKIFKCEWELYELGGRQNINIIVDRKADTYKMINETTCTELVIIKNDTEFLTEINKLLSIKLSQTNRNVNLMSTINIILSIRRILFHDNFHGIYHSIQSYIISYMTKYGYSGTAPQKESTKICKCNVCCKYSFYIPQSTIGMELFTNSLTNSAFKIGINNEKINNYIAKLTDDIKQKSTKKKSIPKPKGAKKVPRKSYVPDSSSGTTEEEDEDDTVKEEMDEFDDEEDM